MPSHHQEPRYRAVNWRDFQAGGYEGRNALSLRPKPQLEPITRLDLDVKAGEKEARFDMAAFRARLGTYSAVTTYTAWEWEMLIAVKNPVWRDAIWQAQGQNAAPAWWPKCQNA